MSALERFSWMHSKVERFPGATALPRRFGTSYVIPHENGMPKIDAFAHPLALYADKLAQGELPCWRDFSFQELRGWHSRFSLVEMASDMSDGTCRILGDHFSAFFAGVLAQGKALSHSESILIPDLLRYIRQLIEGPAIGYFDGRLGYAGREHVRLEVLDLPAADKNGEPRYIMSFAKEKESLDRP